MALFFLFTHKNLVPNGLLTNLKTRSGDAGPLPDGINHYNKLFSVTWVVGSPRQNAEPPPNPVTVPCLNALILPSPFA